VILIGFASLQQNKCKKIVSNREEKYEAHNAAIKEHHDQEQATLIEITKRDKGLPNRLHNELERIIALTVSGSTAGASTLNLSRISQVITELAPLR
jgi:hypothetical protein